MNKGIAQILKEHRSWLFSASIALLVVLWLLSGQLGGVEVDEQCDAGGE